MFFSIFLSLLSVCLCFKLIKHNKHIPNLCHSVHSAMQWAFANLKSCWLSLSISVCVSLFLSISFSSWCLNDLLYVKLKKISQMHFFVRWHASRFYTDDKHPTHKYLNNAKICFASNHYYFRVKMLLPSTDQMKLNMAFVRENDVHWI